MSRKNTGSCALTTPLHTYLLHKPNSLGLCHLECQFWILIKHGRLESLEIGILFQLCQWLTEVWFVICTVEMLKLVENVLSVRRKVLTFCLVPSSRNLRACFHSVAWTTVIMQFFTLYCHRLAAEIFKNTYLKRKTAVILKCWIFLGMCIYT